MHGTSSVTQMDTFGDMILKNKLQMLKFVKTQLLDPEESSLCLGLTLLNQLFTSEDSPDNKDAVEETLKEIRIILQTLSNNASETVRTLARDAKLKCMDYKPSSGRLESEKAFREALAELSDELLPIRAHAMSQLKNLVLSKDEVATQNLESILTIFLDLVDDGDSFIYLNAIKGLNAIADVYPNNALNQIAARYEDSTFSVDYRLRGNVF
jgi:Required for nuclear transport of RNA pol II C-terminus 1